VSVSNTKKDELPQEERENALSNSGTATARLDALEAQVKDLTARLSQVEGVAHSEHTLSKDGVDQIAEHVMGKVQEHIRKTLGHSGEPVRG
jgi:hypothetical protein